MGTGIPGCVVTPILDHTCTIRTRRFQQGSADKSPKAKATGRAATDPSEYARTTENQSPNGAGPSQAPPVFNPQATLPAFYDTVSRVKELLNQVDTQKLEMMELHDVAKKLTKTPELQEAQKDMASLVMSIKKNLSDADKGIKTVQKSNEHDFVELVWWILGGEERVWGWMKCTCGDMRARLSSHVYHHQTQIDAIDVDAPEEEIENKKEALTSVFQMRAQVTISLVAKFDKTCSSFKV